MANSDQPPEAYLLGLNAKDAGQLEDAEVLFEQATEEAPRYANAWLELGLRRLARARFEDAVSCLRQALAITPSLRAAKLGLAVSLIRVDSSAAEATFRDLLLGDESRSGDDARALSMFGDFLAGMGRYAEAEDMFVAAMKGAPDYAYGLECYGELLNALDRDEEAEQCFRRALEVSGQSPRSRYHLGRFLSQFPDDSDEATNHLRAAASQGELKASRLIFELARNARGSSQPGDSTPGDPTQDNSRK